MTSQLSYYDLLQINSCVLKLYNTKIYTICIVITVFTVLTDMQQQRC